MTSFTWLHLTDLHQGMKQQHWLLPDVREIFFADLERLHDKCGPWDLVLFSGDLTQQGTVEDFRKIDELLEELWTHFDKLGSTPKLLAVPGNHDLVRPDEKRPAVKLLREWNEHPDIHEEFWDNRKSQYRQVVVRAFKNYTAWQEKQPFRVENLSTGILPGDFSASIEKDGARLGIAGLNTSFLQLGDGDYKGKLALHTSQFHEACGGDGPKWAKRHHACLLLTHHPSAWLAPESQQHLNENITAHGRFAAHLCGHLHEAGTETRHLWQGRPLFGLEHYGEGNETLHGYTVGTIELNRNNGILKGWPRESRLQENGMEFVPDHSFRLSDNQQHTSPRLFKLLRSYIKTCKVHQTGISEACPVSMGELLQKNQDCAKIIQRYNALNKIKEFFKSKESHIIVLYGEPMVGKTKLLERLPDILDEEYAPLMLTGQGLGLHTANLDDFAFDLATQLTDKLKRRAGKSKISCPLNMPNHDDFKGKKGKTAFNAHWDSLLKAMGGKLPVVMLDEVECLLDAPDRFDPRILNFLDAFTSDQKDRAYFIFVGSERMLTSGNEQFNLLMSRGESVRLRYYDDDAVLLILSAVQEYISDEDNMLHYFIAFSDGHPRVMLTMFGVIFSQLSGSSGKQKIGKAEREAILDNTIDRTHFLQRLLDRLSREECCVVWLISRNVPENQNRFKYSWEDLLALAKQYTVSSSETELKKGVNKLREREWVEWENGNKIFRFKLGILLLWIKRKSIELDKECE